MFPANSTIKTSAGTVLYPLGDGLTKEEADRLGIEHSKRVRFAGGSLIGYPRIYPDKLDVRLAAIRTGEHRPPKQGERYLSGAQPEAFLAPFDMKTSTYQIARVVIVEAKTTYDIRR